MTEKYPPVSIPDSELRAFTSNFVRQEFKIFVSLPRSYSHSGHTYPVLFVLDANACFGMITETTRGLHIGQELPEMILVGIGYGMDDLIQAREFRQLDLTPTETDAVDGPSGGGKYLLKFLSEELLPFVDASYRTDPDDRALFGFSFGGLFALYTLFNQPDLFKRYIIGSPSIWWDDRVVLEYEEQYSAKNTWLAAHVFLSAGDLEPATVVADVQSLADTLAGRGYAGLGLTSHIFADETHLSSAPAAVSRGLRVVFGD